MNLSSALVISFPVLLTCRAGLQGTTVINGAAQASYLEFKAVAMKMSCVQVKGTSHAIQIEIHFIPNVKCQTLVISKHSSVNCCW